MESDYSNHVLNEVVNELFSVSVGTETLGEGVSLLLESTVWGVELEWPEEVVGFLEFWSNSDDLVNKILNTVNTVSSEGSSNDAVVGEWNSLSIDLTISSLVNEVRDGRFGWITISDEWLNNSEHVPGTLVELDESSVV